MKLLIALLTLYASASAYQFLPDQEALMFTWFRLYWYTKVEDFGYENMSEPFHTVIANANECHEITPQWANRTIGAVRFPNEHGAALCRVYT